MDGEAKRCVARSILLLSTSIGTQAGDSCGNSVVPKESMCSSLARLASCSRLSPREFVCSSHCPFAFVINRSFVHAASCIFFCCPLGSTFRARCDSCYICAYHWTAALARSDSSLESSYHIAHVEAKGCVRSQSTLHISPLDTMSCVSTGKGDTSSLPYIPLTCITRSPSTRPHRRRGPSPPFIGIRGSLLRLIHRRGVQMGRAVSNERKV